MKLLDYDGLKRLVENIKALIAKSARNHWTLYIPSAGKCTGTLIDLYDQVKAGDGVEVRHYADDPVEATVTGVDSASLTVEIYYRPFDNISLPQSLRLNSDGSIDSKIHLASFEETKPLLPNQWTVTLPQNGKATGTLVSSFYDVKTGDTVRIDPYDGDVTIGLVTGVYPDQDVIELLFRSFEGPGAPQSVFIYNNGAMSSALTLATRNEVNSLKSQLPNTYAVTVNTTLSAGNNTIASSTATDDLFNNISNVRPGDILNLTFSGVTYKMQILTTHSSGGRISHNNSGTAVYCFCCALDPHNNRIWYFGRANSTNGTACAWHFDIPNDYELKNNYLPDRSTYKYTAPKQNQLMGLLPGSIVYYNNAQKILLGYQVINDPDNTSKNVLGALLWGGNNITIVKASMLTTALVTQKISKTSGYAVDLSV